MDSNAKVIGIVVSSFDEGQNLNFAVAVNLLKTLITKMTTTVTIPDPNLRTVIAETLGKTASATITAGDMTTLFGLGAENQSISNLTGLEHATSLTELNLANNSISAISALENLTHLTELYLANNPIKSTFSLCQLQERNPDLQVDIAIACESYYLLGWLWDINGDGVIDLFDLISLINTLSERTSETGDFNNDGRVDFQDLMEVAEDTDESGTSAGPSALAQLPIEDQSTIVRHWIDIAHAADDGSLAFQDGIANLTRFLASMRPNATTLFANYPNPFNSETWIPYHLANDADVTLTIYDTEGASVRQLYLGYQRTGYYVDRGRAAYWDGRNQLGEFVASGVYFTR